ncbi:MAG: hypothetical protein R3B99_34845 [Polyangiales bacterium]|nr:hypothetical protein [Myxococcales bacterium]
MTSRVGDSDDPGGDGPPTPLAATATSTDATTEGNAADGMEVVERVSFDHEPVPLPEVYQAELDGALFEALMDDLAEHAEIFAVFVKNDAEERADEPRVALDQARLLLLLGKVRGIQIHYRHEGVTWIDTLLRGPASIRIVRMEAPVQEPAPPVEDSRGDGKTRLRVFS